MTANSLDNLENLLFERDGAVATITINRPKVLNALNGTNARRAAPRHPRREGRRWREGGDYHGRG